MIFFNNWIFLSEESAEEELERLIQRSTAGKEK